MSRLDLDEMERTDPELAARLRAHLGVGAEIVEPDIEPDNELAYLDAPATEEELDRARAARPGPEPAPLTAEERRERRRAERRADTTVDTQSWDEFWAAEERRVAAERGDTPTVVIRGIEVDVPHDLPLSFDRRLAAVQTSNREEDMHALISDLFGEGVLDDWIDAGMGRREFEAVLLWGMARGRGRDLSFADAVAAVRTRGKSLQPAPANRTERRASERSGGRSRPTSAASTSSLPRRLPR